MYLEGRDGTWGLGLISPWSPVQIWPQPFLDSPGGQEASLLVDVFVEADVVVGVEVNRPVVAVGVFVDEVSPQ